MAKQESKPRTQAVQKRQSGSSAVQNVQQPENQALSLLQMAMTNSDVDLDKLDKIMQMYERQQSKEAEKAFHRDMALVQEGMPSILRDARILGNDGAVRSNYAKYETISKAARPIINQHGFSTSFKPEVNDGKIKVIGIVSHRDGHQETAEIILPLDASGKKNEVQSYGSSLSYGKRYLFTMMFDIAVEGEDNDGNDMKDRDLDELSKMLKEVKTIDDLQMYWDGLSVGEQGIATQIVSLKRGEIEESLKEKK